MLASPVTPYVENMCRPHFSPHISELESMASSSTSLCGQTLTLAFIVEFLPTLQWLLTMTPSERCALSPISVLSAMTFSWAMAPLPTLTLSQRTESLMTAPSSMTALSPIIEFDILTSASILQLAPIMTLPSSFVV